MIDRSIPTNGLRRRFGGLGRRLPGGSRLALACTAALALPLTGRAQEPAAREPGRLELAFARASSTAAPAALPRAPGPWSPDASLERAVLELPTRGGVDRAALDGELPPFDALPGGIVLGRVAELRGTLAGQPTLRWRGPELVLEVDGLDFALPEDHPGELRACLAFAAREAGSEVLVDVPEGGPRAARLAREFTAAPLAALVVDADLAPGKCLDVRAARSFLGTRKSLLLDRRVRIAFEPGGSGPARLLVETELELRVVVPAGPAEAGARGGEPAALEVARFAIDPLAGRVVQESGPKALRLPDTLARELRPLARLAGWMALFRWVESCRPGTLRELRGEPAPPEPSLIEPGLSLIESVRAFAREPAPVPPRARAR